MALWFWSQKVWFHAKSQKEYHLETWFLKKLRKSAFLSLKQWNMFIKTHFLNANLDFTKHLTIFLKMLHIHVTYVTFHQF